MSAVRTASLNNPRIN